MKLNVWDSFGTISLWGINVINADSLLKQIFVLSKIVRAHSAEAKERCEMGIDTLKRRLLSREETICSMGMTESQVKGGKEWIRTHKGTQVLDTPLWVLISLGILALEEEDDVTR